MYSVKERHEEARKTSSVAGLVSLQRAALQVSIKLSFVNS